MAMAAMVGPSPGAGRFTPGGVGDAQRMYIGIGTLILLIIILLLIF
jgi:hypothetical protein